MEEGYRCPVAQVACCTGSGSPWAAQSCVCPHSPCSRDCGAIDSSPWSHYSHCLICHCALERHLVASMVWLWSLPKTFSVDMLTFVGLCGCLSQPHQCSLQHSLQLSPSFQRPGTQRPLLKGMELCPSKRHLWNYFPALNEGREQSDAENVGEPAAAGVPPGPGCWAVHRCAGWYTGALGAQQDFAVGIFSGLPSPRLILKGGRQWKSSLTKALCCDAAKMSCVPVTTLLSWRVEAGDVSRGEWMVCAGPGCSCWHGTRLSYRRDSEGCLPGPLGQDRGRGPCPEPSLAGYPALAVQKKRVRLKLFLGRTRTLVSSGLSFCRHVYI